MPNDNFTDMLPWVAFFILVVIVVILLPLPDEKGDNDEEIWYD